MIGHRASPHRQVPGRRATWLLVALLCSWSAICVAPAGAEDNEVCLSCHADQQFRDPAGESLFVDRERFGHSVHSLFDCTDCHAAAAEIPHPEKLEPVALEVCATCHQDSVDAYRRGTHSKARDEGVTEAAACGDCHGDIHSTLSHDDPASRAHWSNLVHTCAQCHAKQELADKFKLPLVRSVETYLESGHARAIAAGRPGAVCSDCHGVHDVRPSHDPLSSVARSNISTTCGKCHEEIAEQYGASVHGAALARGIREVPACTDCHGEHRILGSSDQTSLVAAANVSTQTCGRCHADERLSEKFGLSVDNVATFRDSFHGLSLRAGRQSVAHCDSCHGVHNILPSSDPKSTIHPDNLAGTCGQCHPGAGSSFAIGSVHGLSESTGSWAAGWVRTIYLWLIGITIGSMLVHNLLDLGRKARTPNAPVPPVAPGQPPRMSRVVRWQHGLVMVSFTTLVYTGFALTYPESWWSAPLLRWESDYALRGLVHRLSAIVLLVALGWHVVHLLVDREQRRCMRRILPARQDLVNLRLALSYYFGRRAHPPRSGTFNYAEKAEYWAFLWGTVVMTLTGFLLWFENLTLRYLPTWAVDVATAFHFWEAVLATLAILVWHLYWVIFDPDVYPMDWTWWNGQPPAARTHERHTEPEQEAKPE
jgi:cytochrome b subunit of formate dehydrogenase